MDIHLQQLRNFMELAKCLNFTKAAMNLYIAQPALSQQIADLEKQLGVTLFERSSRSVSLTPAGEILQKVCPEILNRMDSVHQQLLSAQAGLRGNLKISYLSAFQTMLPLILRKYRELYPDVAVELNCNPIREQQMALRNQDADIIFTVLHPEMLFNSGDYAQREIWREGLDLVMRKDHPFALSGGKDYSLLQDSTFCVLTDDTVPDYQRLVHNACDNVGIPITKVAAYKSSGPVLIQLETSMDVSIFSSHDSTRFSAYQKELVTFPLQENSLVFCALWNPNSKNAALPLFLDVMETTLLSDKNE